VLRKETALPSVIKLIQELQSEELLKDFILVGGTALSLQLGHRISEDIDLFSTTRHDYDRINNFLNDKYKDVEYIRGDEGSLRLVINGIIVDMLGMKGKILEMPLREDNITLLGIKDISAMKLMAIRDRKKPKDFVDVAYLIEMIGLKTMLECYQEKYDKENILDIKKALASANEVNPYEWENVKMLRNDIPLSMVKRVIDDALLAHEKEHRKNKKQGFNIKKLFG